MGNYCIKCGSKHDGKGKICVSCTPVKMAKPSDRKIMSTIKLGIIIVIFCFSSIMIWLYLGHKSNKISNFTSTANSEYSPRIWNQVNVSSDKEEKNSVFNEVAGIWEYRTNDNEGQLGQLKIESSGKMRAYFDSRINNSSARYQNKFDGSLHLDKVTGFLFWDVSNIQVEYVYSKEYLLPVYSDLLGVPVENLTTNAIKDYILENEIYLEEPDVKAIKFMLEHMKIYDNKWMFSATANELVEIDKMVNTRQWGPLNGWEDYFGKSLGYYEWNKNSPNTLIWHYKGESSTNIIYNKSND